MGFILTIASCQLPNNNPENNWESSTDFSTSQQIFDDIFDLVDEETRKDPFLRSAGCATVTLENAGSFPAYLTIDFGDSCSGQDGKIRSGKIIVSYTGRYREAGTIITVDLENYKVNNLVNTFEVEGSKTIKNLGADSNGFISFHDQIHQASIKSDNGEEIEYEADYTYQWTEGISTTWETDGANGLQDDVYLITGSSKGTDRNGIQYEAEITVPLKHITNCKWRLVKGEIEIRPEGLSTRILDFGDGVCDGKLTVTVDEYSFDIIYP